MEKITCYNDFIKPGVEAVYIQREDARLWYYDPIVCVVKIGPHRPYYTDGSPDPRPDDILDWCHVEAYPVDSDCRESQFRVSDLHPIQPDEERTEALHCGRCCRVIGRVLEEDDFGDWVETDYFVIEEDGKKVVTDDIVIRRRREDLSREELVQLRGEICLGSLYLSDYCNTLGIAAYDASEMADEFLEAVEAGEVRDTPEDFATYFEAA